MVDITHKTNTLRIAVAQAIVKTSSPDTIALVKANQVPKGNVFEMAKAAGLLGVKKTPELLPDCHPLPIESTQIDYTIEENNIIIQVTVKTIYKTGVEVEAMHGASVVALTLYDMLKPIDKQVEISTIRLLNKKGGKSSYNTPIEGLSAKVVVCSDSVSQGTKEDKSGKWLVSEVESLGFATSYAVIPDDKEQIQAQLVNLTADLLIFSGGTGVGPRDVTSEAVSALLDTRLHGVEEQLRRFGQERMPYAMLSRSVAGIKGTSLVLVFPGSLRAVQECVQAIFPHVFHVYSVLKGQRHD